MSISENEMSEIKSDIDYIEKILKKIIDELKENKSLSQDFIFLTKAEREEYANKIMSEFINHD